ncbi:glutamine amidotransferase [Sphingomonas sp. ID0503]|uniref:glutamine amidotransferase n=1 Tax=Sphingomonas sp. ID0503 TaxID=3399691 RepID=UPI003AFA74B9
MKSALIVRHVPYEGVAGFRLPIEEAGYVVDRIDVADPAFQSVDLIAPDLLVMMGGPMGVYETEAHPWIPCEVAKLAQRVAARRPTLGVCLGAQMVAAAAGARVYPGPVKEVGFAPVEITEAGHRSPLARIDGVPVLHWHGDTFDLPEGATVLARTANYTQAFSIGPNILAIQCHPEMGEDERFEAWLAGGEAYAAEAGTTPERLRADYTTLGPPAVSAGRALARRWLAGLA